MTPKPHYWGLVRIATIQTIILVAAWTFFAVVRVKKPLTLPVSTAVVVSHHPTATTIVVTLIATALSYITTKWCFAPAVKHALRQRVTEGPITLSKFGVGVSMAGPSPVLKLRYFFPTLCIFLAFTILTSAWTTFLAPAAVVSQIQLNGYELDLTSPSFDTLLGNNLNSIVGDGGDDISLPTELFSLTTYALMGGITTASANATGQVGRLDFNDAQYNLSTGGILPAVAGYINDDTQQKQLYGGSAIKFAGGAVPATLTSNQQLGLSSNYTVTQQGLTVNVSCANYTDTNASGITVQEATIDSSPALQVTCNDGTTSTVPFTLGATSGIPMVVCPSRNLTLWYETDNVSLVLQGYKHYKTLPLTLCEIIPIVTRSTVEYGAQLITSTGVLNTTLASYQQHLLQWIVTMVGAEASSYQTGTGNFVGYMLEQLIDATKSSEEQANQAQVLVSAFFRGVLELMGTDLRSGYAAYPQNVTSAMLTPITGVQMVTTIGWSFEKTVHAYPLFFITLTALLTYAAIYFSIYPPHGYEALSTKNASTLADSVPATAMSKFDPTNSIHLIVASMSERPGPESDVKDESAFWKDCEATVVSFRG